MIGSVRLPNLMNRYNAEPTITGGRRSMVGQQWGSPQGQPIDEGGLLAPTDPKQKIRKRFGIFNQSPQFENSLF